MGDGCSVKAHDDGDRLGRILGRVDGLGGDSDDRVQGYDVSLILEHVRDGCPTRQRSGRLHSDCVTLGVIPDELAARFWWKEEWRILPVIEVHDQHAACRGSLPSEDAALVLLFSLVVSGQLELRRIDGWRKIGSVLSQHTAVAA